MPFVVCAVTINSAGTESATTASEWYRVAVNGEGSEANTPWPVCSTRLVLPCMSSGAWVTTPPNTSPSAWWPRHTPSIGTRSAAHSSMTSRLEPASLGVPGPGETRTPSNPVIELGTASLRTTVVCAPSCWR